VTLGWMNLTTLKGQAVECAKLDFFRLDLAEGHLWKAETCKFNNNKNMSINYCTVIVSAQNKRFSPLGSVF